MCAAHPAPLYLIQELAGLIGKGVMGEHAFVAVDALPRRVVQLARKVPCTVR